MDLIEHQKTVYRRNSQSVICQCDRTREFTSRREPYALNPQPDTRNQKSQGRNGKHKVQPQQVHSKGSSRGGRVWCSGHNEHANNELKGRGEPSRVAPGSHEPTGIKKPIGNNAESKISQAKKNNTIQTECQWGAQNIKYSALPNSSTFFSPYRCRWLSTKRRDGWFVV